MSQRSGNLRVPQNFQAPDSWEQLQDVVMWIHNRLVVQEFKDLAPEDQDWIVELRTPRQRLRYACTVREDDSAIMVLIRMFIFYVILRKAAEFATPVYGIPVPSFQEARKFQPQIQLYFVEDANDVEEGYPPVTGEISFRLMRETSETLTEADVRRYAQKVRTTFATGNAFVWRKGKVMCSYTERKKGYQLQLLCRDKNEAKRVIEQILDIQGHTPDWQYLNISENEQSIERFPTIPSTERILGRNRRMPRQRPIANVRFQSAYLHVHGLANPIVLVDRTGRHRRVIAS